MDPKKIPQVKRQAEALVEVQVEKIVAYRSDRKAT